ncbi:MAG: hypothetical protein J6N52_01220 [Clostridia bacterium]|nr:hypothetical protein [Clostridia bacterium]
MKIIKKLISVLAVLSFFSAGTYAEADVSKNLSYKATADSGNISVTEDKLTGQTDYSNLNVNVIKDINGQKTVIYSGALGGYADGAFSNIDFSEKDFIFILDWNTMGNEAICIVPVSGKIKTPFNTFSVKNTADNLFRLDDALAHTEIVDGINKKTYNVNVLPDEYLEYMETLGRESGNYGDGSVPAPTITYDYSISKINLRDNEDMPSDRLVNGGVLQSVTVESNGIDDNVILAVAEYNGYTLTKLTSYSINLENNKDVVMTGYKLSDITPDTSIKLFVWDAYWGTNPKANPVTLFPENDVDISINFLYDDIYSEKELQGGQTITAEITARSTKWWPQAMSLYFALYDENDKLVSIANTNSSIISDGNYQFLSVALQLPDKLPANYKIKSFVWNTQSMHPYMENETISCTDDYYADNISEAKTINISKAVKGRINTDNDLDYIKFVPSSTQDCLIQISGNGQTAGTLYNADGDIITSIDNFSNQTIGALTEMTLIKDQTYYLGLSGTAESNYTLTVAPNNKSNDSIFVTGSGIAAEGSAISDKAQTFKAELISSDGTAICTREFNSDANGGYNLEIPADISNGEYYFIISQNNTVKKLWHINTLVNNSTFEAEKGEYCIIPIAASNTASLENVVFSVCYNADDFELYDACDLTADTENTVTEISDKQIRILKVCPSYMAFEAAQIDSNGQNNIINTVKLKSKKNAVIKASVCAYTVQ